MLLILYCIMCGVTFYTTLIGNIMLKAYVDSYAYVRVKFCVISAIFWPIGFPISIGMIAVAWIVQKYNGGK